MSRRAPRLNVWPALGGALLLAAWGCAERAAAAEEGAAAAEEAAEEEAAEEAAAPGEEEAPKEGRVIVSEETAPPGEPLELRGVKLVHHEGQSGVFVKLSSTPSRVEHFALEKPDRVVIDVFGALPGDFRDIERAPEDDPLIARVRVTRRTDGMRVVLDLKRPAKYELTELKEMVVAFVGERTGGPEPAREEVLYSTEAPVATARAETRAEAPSRAPAPGRAVPAAPAAKRYTGQKITLDFKDADILNVLRILSEVGGINIVATDDVRGRVTLRLVDVPWDQALDIVLESNRLDKVQIGNVIRVSTVTRLKEEREAQLAAQEAAKELEPLKTEYIAVNYMKVADKEDKLDEKIKEIALSERGKVKLDKRTNTVIVTDIRAGIESTRDLIARLDTQTPQVLIESNIVEATVNFARDLGIQWGFQYGVGPQFGNPTGKEFPASVVFGGGTSRAQGDPGTFFGAVPGTGPPATSPAGVNAGPTVGGFGVPSVPLPFIADFPARSVSAGEGSALDLALGSIDGSKALELKLTALERDGKGKILSRPRVVTINNLAAKIESIRIFRVRLPGTGTVVATGTGGVAGTATAATEQIRTGITLEVTPQVSADGFILMDIRVKSSTADFTQQVDNIPAEISREAQLNVLIKEGETLVIGGVLRDDTQNNESGMPYLRRIPFLGWLFKRLFRSTQREELLVFLTPRIVKGRTQTASLPTARELWANRTP